MMHGRPLQKTPFYNKKTKEGWSFKVQPDVQPIIDGMEIIVATKEIETVSEQISMEQSVLDSNDIQCINDDSDMIADKKEKEQLELDRIITGKSKKYQQEEK